MRVGFEERKEGVEMECTTAIGFLTTLETTILHPSLINSHLALSCSKKVLGRESPWCSASIKDDHETRRIEMPPELSRSFFGFPLLDMPVCSIEPGERPLILIWVHSIKEQ